MFQYLLQHFIHVWISSLDIHPCLNMTGTLMYLSYQCLSHIYIHILGRNNCNWSHWNITCCIDYAIPDVPISSPELHPCLNIFSWHSSMCEYDWNIYVPLISMPLTYLHMLLTSIPWPFFRLTSLSMIVNGCQWLSIIVNGWQWLTMTSSHIHTLAFLQIQINSNKNCAKLSTSKDNIGILELSALSQWEFNIATFLHFGHRSSQWMFSIFIHSH